MKIVVFQQYPVQSFIGRGKSNNTDTDDGDDQNDSEDSDNFLDVGVSLQELRTTRATLVRIMDSLQSGNMTTDILVVLVTLLLIGLVSVATYICTSQGVCELSRYA